MSRGLLSEEELKAIDRQLPDTERSTDLVHSVDPNFVAMRHGPESRLPEAAVCLHDASQMIQEASEVAGASLRTL